MNELTKESIEYMVARLIERANEAVKNSNEAPMDDFAAGRRVAYYEMLDILRSELLVAGQELKDFGLDIDLESKIA